MIQCFQVKSCQGIRALFECTAPSTSIRRYEFVSMFDCLFVVSVNCWFDSTCSLGSEVSGVTGGLINVTKHKTTTAAIIAASRAGKPFVEFYHSLPSLPLS